jgi:transitional endoplasmic reticulum ATPase
MEKKKESGPKGFESVAGMLELKALLTKDVIKPLRNPDKYKKFNVTIPNGILLFGPPGCGKTFIVEKLAEEVGYNFQVVPPSRIGSKYIHETSDNIAKIFTEAKNQAPTILFFDEFEALVPKRESLGSEGQFKNEEINEFLTHLNNASKMGILVVGATNQPELIDSAVMRAGRMDKIILVPPPDFEARKELFSSRLSKVPHSGDIDFRKLAEKTEYYSSSDIAAIIEAAGRIAGDQDLDEINQDLMEHVIEGSKPSISKSQIESFNAFSHLERK